MRGGGDMDAPKMERMPTCELAELLAARPGVEAVAIQPHEAKSLEIGGPAVVLIVTD